MSCVSCFILPCLVLSYLFCILVEHGSPYHAMPGRPGSTRPSCQHLSVRPASQPASQPSRTHTCTKIRTQAHMHTDIYIDTYIHMYIYIYMGNVISPLHFLASHNKSHIHQFTISPFHHSFPPYGQASSPFHHFTIPFPHMVRPVHHFTISPFLSPIWSELIVEMVKWFWG